jgi:hypothetical protein
MPTYLYLSTDSPEPVSLALTHVGPTSRYDKNYRLLTTSVPARASTVRVLEVDRGDSAQPADTIQVTELRLYVRGEFVGALEIMLDGSPGIIKNAIHWSCRVPRPDVMTFTDDHNTHTVRYQSGETVYEIDVTGKSAGLGFDDIYVTVTATERGNAASLRDTANGRVVVFAVTPGGQPTLKVAPFSDEAPQWQDLPVPLPANTRLVGDVGLVTSYGGGVSSPVLIATTDAGQLWVRRLDEPEGFLLDLPNPFASVVVTDIVGDSGNPRADVFLTQRNSTGEYDLSHRTLSFQGKPHFVDQWTPWSRVTSARPSYTPGSPYRYLFTTAKSVLGNEGVYYAYANGQDDSWGIWHSLPNLPSGRKPQTVKAFAYYSDEHGGPQYVGVLCTDENGRLYFMPDHSFVLSSWMDGGIGSVSGDIVPVPFVNVTPVVVRSGGVLMVAWVIVKEEIVTSWSPVRGAADDDDVRAGFWLNPPTGPHDEDRLYLVSQPSSGALRFLPLGSHDRDDRGPDRDGRGRGRGDGRGRPGHHRDHATVSTGAEPR